MSGERRCPRCNRTVVVNLAPQTHSCLVCYYDWKSPTVAKPESPPKSNTRQINIR